jgi:hypothetical protein
MPRCSATVRPATAGDTTHPMASIYATTAVRPVLREVGVFNTTTTQVPVGLVRLTTVGTPGAAAVEVNEDDPSHTILATVAGTHTGTAPTFTADAFIRRVMLGAAIGSGVIWTFGGNGLIIPNTTGDGVGVVVCTGTSQICDVYLVWDE